MSIQIPDSLIEALAGARTVAVVTGSGISAESGIPTFRDARTGLWANYRPEDLATPEAFRRNPALVWQWYQWRRKQVGEAQPNPGHEALARLERTLPDLRLITQNVDGLHRRAGSRKVVEFHGNVMNNRCLDAGHPAGPADPDAESPPRCRECGSPLRPDVVWFGEMIPENALHQAYEAVDDCDVLLSIGTSAQVYPAAGLVEVALQHGATVAEINPDTTPMTSQVGFALGGNAAELLPVLADRIADGK